MYCMYCVYCLSPMDAPKPHTLSARHTHTHMATDYLFL